MAIDSSRRTVIAGTALAAGVGVLLFGSDSDAHLSSAISLPQTPIDGRKKLSPGDDRITYDADDFREGLVGSDVQRRGSASADIEPGYRYAVQASTYGGRSAEAMLGTWVDFDIEASAGSTRLWIGIEYEYRATLQTGHLHERPRTSEEESVERSDGDEPRYDPSASERPIRLSGSRLLSPMTDTVGMAVGCRLYGLDDGTVVDTDTHAKAATHRLSGLRDREIRERHSTLEMTRGVDPNRTYRVAIPLIAVAQTGLGPSAVDLRTGGNHFTIREIAVERY